MHFKCVITMLNCCVLVSLDWAEPMMFLSLHVICSCIRTFNSLYSYILMLLVLLCLSLFLPFSFFQLVASWHLYENPLCPRTLFIMGLLLLLTLLLMFGFVMIKLEGLFGELFLTRHSFGTPSYLIGFFRY